MRKAWCWPSVIAASLLCGCAAYRPAPLEPAKAERQFETRTLSNPKLCAYLKTNLEAEQSGCPTQNWNLAALMLVGFYYSPQLAVSEARVGQADAAIITARGGDQIPRCCGKCSAAFLGEKPADRASIPVRLHTPAIVHRHLNQYRDGKSSKKAFAGCRLKRGHVHFETTPPYVELRTRKRRGGGERMRRQYLSPMAAEALQAQLADGASADWIFPSTRGYRGGGRTTPDGMQRQDGANARLAEACGRAGIPHYGRHAIRRWGGTEVGAMGFTEKAIARFLGQTTTAATGRYVWVEDR